jgi:restriction system protein
MLTTQEKRQRLSELANQRKAARLDRYACLADFHNGIYECDHVSPWTKSGNNVDADVMVIGQDWASADMLAKWPEHVAELGYDPRLLTNRNLDDLLARHLGLRRSDCYLTNLFVFIKSGDASSSIPFADLVWNAHSFTIPQIEIISPKLVICLGLRTFRALMRAAGLNPARTTDAAIAAPQKIGSALVHCAAHTGALGTLNRSKELVERDWKALANVLAPNVTGAVASP